MPVDQPPRPIASPGRIQASLQDRLSFSQAISLLVGLTGCTPERAVDALRTTAAELDLHPARFARLFLDHMMTLDDDDSEVFVARLEDAARATGTAGPQLTATPIHAGDLKGVTVAGELDVATVQLLQDTVTEVYRTAATPTTPARSVPAFLLNLADLTFLDVVGLRALARVHEQTQARGDHLHVAAPVAAAPRLLLRLAVGSGWLAPLFDSSDPHDPIGTPPATPGSAPAGRRRSPRSRSPGLTPGFRT